MFSSALHADLFIRVIYKMPFRGSQTNSSLSRPAPHSKCTLHSYYSLTSGSVWTDFLKASATGTRNAQQCRRVESRARSAHSARVIDESDDQKNLSSRSRRRRHRRCGCAARGEAGSAALVCAESARARPPRSNTFRERAFPPGVSILPCRSPVD